MHGIVLSLDVEITRNEKTHAETMCALRQQVACSCLTGFHLIETFVVNDP